MIFESHAHYEDKAFDEDREGLLDGMRKHQVGTVINVCSTVESLQKTIDLTKRYDFIYGAVGIHPSETAELTEEIFEKIRKLCALDKVVAVGEIGLDYYWKEPDPEYQKMWFKRQLLLAQEVGLPVIIHSREAAKDTLDMMKALHAEKSGGVIHCYSYSKEMAAEFLKLDYYFGIGGVITYKNAKKLKEAVEYLPMDRILLETDSPYLTPVPNRGQRNSSWNLPYVAEEIGQIKGISAQDVIEITEKNAQKLFGIMTKNKTKRNNNQ